MLTDRDNQQLVKMHPYTDEYNVPRPEAKRFNFKSSCSIEVTLPFLKNNKGLQAGDLLVLPFDGGCTEISSASPSQSASSSRYEPIEPRD